MKNLVMVGMLACACAPSWAEWSFVASTNDRKFYIDVASIRTEGATLTAWTMSDIPPKVDPILEDLKRQQESHRRSYEQYMEGADRRARAAFVAGSVGVPGTASLRYNESLARDREQTLEFQRRDFDFNKAIRAMQTSGPAGVLSVATKSEYDCKAMQVKRISQNHYAEGMASGEPVNTVGPSQNWTEVAPNSIGATVAKRVCSGR